MEPRELGDLVFCLASVAEVNDEDDLVGAMLKDEAT